MDQEEPIEVDQHEGTAEAMPITVSSSKQSI
jgi:hypothetical protein